MEQTVPRRRRRRLDYTELSPEQKEQCDEFYEANPAVTESVSNGVKCWSSYIYFWTDGSIEHIPADITKSYVFLKSIAK